MKKSDMKARIKEAAINEIPDVFAKINLGSIIIEPKTKKKFQLNFGRLLSVFLTTFVFIFSGYIIYNAYFSPLNNTNTPLETDIEILGFQVVTGAVLLNHSVILETYYQDSIYIQNINQDLSTGQSIDDYYSDIGSLIHLMEVIVNSNNLITYVTVESDNLSYTNAFDFTAYDLTKTKLMYRVYYNQSDDQIEGIIRIDQNDYYFSSVDQEIEVANQTLNRIMIRNTSTETQQAFTYKQYYNNELVVENDLIIKQVQQKIQVFASLRKGNLIIDLNVQRRSLSNMDELEVEIEVNNNGNMIQGRFRVVLELDSLSNTYNYRYSQDRGNSSSQPRGPFSGPQNNPRGFS